MATQSLFLRGRVLWELARYDLLFALRGWRGVRPNRGGQLQASKLRRSSEDAGELPSAIAAAVRDAAPFYWKPVRCLQRSMITARMMHRHGIRAEVVIGYRPIPFFSHAWVEVGGRVVNDSPTYQMRLQVLERW